jgi:hypothetical protein
MNHAVISWLQGSGHEVILLLVRPRLPALLQRYDSAPVVGRGITPLGKFLIVRDLRAILQILAQKFPNRARAYLQKRFRAAQYGQAETVLGAFASAEQSAWCARQMPKIAPDALLVDTIFRAPVLREPRLAAFRSVIIAHDLFHLRHRALREAGYRVYPPELTQAAEAAWLRLGDAIAAIQPAEAAAIRAMCPDRPVCIAPMPALPCPRPPAISRIPGRLVFVGSATLPNLDGLRWLFAEIWPLLRAENPDVTLDLAGDCGDAFPSLPPGVNRLGRVAALAPVLHRAGLAISPLRVGSGLKIKILDYARHGLFTVATPESLAGFAEDEKAPFIAASGASAFAQAVAAAIAAGNPDHERQALDYVTAHYDVKSSFAGLAELLGIPAP